MINSKQAVISIEKTPISLWDLLYKGVNSLYRLYPCICFAIKLEEASALSLRLWR